MLALKKENIMETLYWAVGLSLGWLIYAGLLRRFSPETLVNGMMDKEKAADWRLQFLKMRILNFQMIEQLIALP